MKLTYSLHSLSPPHTPSDATPSATSTFKMKMMSVSCLAALWVTPTVAKKALRGAEIVDLAQGGTVDKKCDDGVSTHKSKCPGDCDNGQGSPEVLFTAACNGCAACIGGEILDLASAKYTGLATNQPHTLGIIQWHGEEEFSFNCAPGYTGPECNDDEDGCKTNGECRFFTFLLVLFSPNHSLSLSLSLSRSLALSLDRSLARSLTHSLSRARGPSSLALLVCLPLWSLADRTDISPPLSARAQIQVAARTTER